MCSITVLYGNYSPPAKFIINEIIFSI